MRQTIAGWYLLATFASIFIGVVQAQGPAPSPLIALLSPPAAIIPAASPQPSLAAAPELTKADFETFLDALIPSQLRNRNIAGAVVSVVKDGQVLFRTGGLEHIVIFGDAINPWRRAFHIFGWLLIRGVILLIVASVRFVRLPVQGLWFRAHAILLAIGGIAFGVFAWQYHLLDTSLRF